MIVALLTLPEAQALAFCTGYCFSHAAVDVIIACVLVARESGVTTRHHRPALTKYTPSGKARVPGAPDNTPTPTCPMSQATATQIT